MAKPKCPFKRFPLPPPPPVAYTPRADKAEGTDIRNRGYFPGSGYTEEELAWIKAVEKLQKRTGRKFLSHVDFLRLARSIGYRRDPTPETPMTTLTDVPPPAPAAATIRELIAVHALQGVLAAHSGEVAMPAAAETARMVREYVDALLAEMKRNPIA